jgi:hypothetical protein
MRSLLVIAALMFLNTQPSEAATKKINSSLKVHEWGTFTSVQGSNGAALPGLHHEEEALPSFVHNLNMSIEANRSIEVLSVGVRCPKGCKHCCKGECCDSFTEPNQPLHVTQKMETPVLYFYSEVPATVDVTVDFPQGLISQFYPQATSVTPVAARSIGNGQLHYSGLQVLTEKVTVPPVIAGNVYAPARETAANFVRSGGENEKFIFYRGLGDFTTSLQVTSTLETITLKDTFGRGIPYLLALNIRNGKGAFKELGSLTADSSRRISAPDLSKDLTPSIGLEEFEKSVGEKLVTALIASGLYQDEAQSMVNTWKLSYFHNEGTRILYVLPRGETDSVLPIQISPEPSELVRTLVGRVEILTKSEEEDLLVLVTDAALANDSAALNILGRFKEPKLRRLLQMTHDIRVTSFINANLE